MADVVQSTAPQEEPDGAKESPAASAAPATGAAQDSGAAEGGRKRKKGSFWRELPILVVTALVLTFLIQTFLARVYVIPSQSMEMTLIGCDTCTNDRVLVDKVIYRFRDPSPGDVVVFRGPDTWEHTEFTAQRSSNFLVNWIQTAASVIGLAPPDEKDYIKRVIATGGQTVMCCDDKNRVTVDGKPLDEPYIYWDPTRGSSKRQRPFEAVKVPDKHIWVMGDNRNNSFDSREQGGGGERGAVPVDNVIGKARTIVLPVNRWSGVGDHNPQASALAAPGWQEGLPAGVGLAAAFPVVILGRRLRERVFGNRTLRRAGRPDHGGDD